MSQAHLFVYGTLLAAAAGTMGRAQRDRLARESRSLGAASLAGRLVDLGRYPGLVEAERPGEVVRGEVVVLDNAERSLRWLDAYEGLVPDEHDHNEYAREQRDAVLDSGEVVTAWVYIYRRPVAGARVIEGGDWLAYVVHTTRGNA